MRLAALGIELIRVGCDVAEQVQRMGGEAGLRRTEFQRAVGETPRVITLADLQASEGVRHSSIRLTSRWALEAITPLPS